VTERLPYSIRFGSWVPRLTGHACVTIRRTIYCRHRWLSAETHAHEYRHIEQWAEYGVVRFLVRYFAEQVRHGYAGNRFEVEAHLYAAMNAPSFRAYP